MNLFWLRGINLIKLTASYLFARVTHRQVHWGNPAAVGIEPNNSCNLHCPECPTGMNGLTRTHGLMQPPMFYSIIDQLSPNLSWLTLYFQGEPYMSKYFFDFIAYARSRKIFVATSTNGHFLDETSVRKTLESGLNRLIISLDGADRQSYEAYRAGGDFDRVIDGIRLLVSEKRRLKTRNPEIVLQCLVLKTNEHQLDAVRKLGNKLGVDRVTFKTAQFNDFENGNPLMPERSKYSRYAVKEKVKSQKSKVKTDEPARYRIKNMLPDACFRMWSSCVITWDGKVVPCCFDKDATHELGDLTRKPFNEIWRSSAYTDFRKKILMDRKSVGICSNCSQTF